MKAIIRRTSILGDAKPCDEAKPAQATLQDWRTLKTLDEARKHKFLGEEWFKEGTNHREEKGMVVRDLPCQKVWAIEINSLDDLIALHLKYGDIIITGDGDDEYKEYPLQLEIYDDYRE